MTRHGNHPTRRTKPRYQRGTPDREQTRLRRWVSEWRLALRIARRSVWRSRGTSIIVTLMVMLPVAGFSAAAIIGQSTFPTPGEKIAAELGQNEAKLLTWLGPDSGMMQDLYNPSGATGGDGTGELNNPLDEAGVRAQFPAGTDITVINVIGVTAETAHGVGHIQATVGPLWNSTFNGRTHVEAGAVPKNANEVMVSESALARLGVQVGDQIRLTEPSARVTVTGVLDDAMSRDAQEWIYAPRGTFDVPTDPASTSYYLPHTEVTQGMIADLNKAGVTVLSRSILEDASSLDLAATGGFWSQYGVILVMAAVFAIFEVVLLAGAAFAVGARKQQRALATLASVGGDKRMLHRVVLSQGVVLGLIGGSIGIAVGIPTAALVMALTNDGSATLYWGFHAEPLVLGGVLLLAVIVGLISAVIPARSAAKFDVLAALRGSRKPASPSRAVPRFGLVLIVLGVSVTIGSALTIRTVLWDEHPTMKAVLLGCMIAGPLIAEIGAILCGGLVLRVVARIISRVGLGARLASRDSAANTRRSVPAFASVMVTAFLATTAVCIGTVQMQQVDAGYVYATLPGQATIFVPKNLDNSERRSDNDIEAVVARDWPDASIARIYEPELTLDSDTGVGADGTYVTAEVPTESLCPSDPRSPEYDPGVWDDPASAARESQRLTAADARCSATSQLETSTWNQIVVTDSAGLSVLLGGEASNTVLAAFNNGSVVTSVSSLVNDSGRLTLQWWPPDGGPAASSSQTPGQDPLRMKSVDAIEVTIPYPLYSRVVMSIDTAQSLGITVRVSHLLASPIAGDFSQPQIDNLTGDLQVLDSGVFVENGPDQTWLFIIAFIVLIAGVLFVGASAIAIGLARADGRADDATLSAVGATRMLRRSFSFWQALTLVGVGTLTGAAAGLLISYALRLAGAFNSGPFSPPWLMIGAIAVGMPLVIAIGSWLVASRPTTLAHRATIG